MRTPLSSALGAAQSVTGFAVTAPTQSQFEQTTFGFAALPATQGAGRPPLLLSNFNPSPQSPLLPCSLTSQGVGAHPTSPGPLP